ncbi:G protein-coupled glucose receptor regulating Gpa2-domain-containing protein [Phyllosticta citrichinensis]|uniref:G protein-coupled glucose receptor regulating Gpa2-domain-containing protein n=1 Tax=Phyllosticta citrichinensis TaxID=1130410 RepID=A0ABR1XL99_9PEZI
MATTVAPPPKYDPRIALPALVGSLLSCVATSAVLVCYALYRGQQRSFRHALVFNLALAEFVNTLNNSISGSIKVANHGGLTPGFLCSLNGFIGQLSIQAADFSILAIALVTLLTVKHFAYMPRASWGKKLAICLSVYIVPVVTSTVSVSLRVVAPVSGNWCWISQDKTALRYALGHGWRFAVMFGTMFIYIYLAAYMRKNFFSSYLSDISSGASYGISDAVDDDNDDDRTESQIELANILKNPAAIERDDSPLRGELPMHQHAHHHRRPSQSNAGSRAARRGTHHSSRRPSAATMGKGVPATTTVDLFANPFPANEAVPSDGSPLPMGTAQPAASPGAGISGAAQSRKVEREVKRMMMLNAYPVLYVLLWIPGAVNRFFEASGHKVKWLAIAQSSTQYVGLANALTYGINEHLWRRIRHDVRGWFRRGKS